MKRSLISAVILTLSVFAMSGSHAWAKAGGHDNNPLTRTCWVTIDGVTSYQSFTSDVFMDKWDAVYGP
ncbi:MAG TPA: hypothetical protein VF898_00895, partial [Chloroflexota bacterium]